MRMVVRNIGEAIFTASFLKGLGAAAIATSLSASALHADTTIIPSSEAVVTRVVDGDTIDVRFQDRAERIRIRDIDAPEMSQPFGKECRDLLWGHSYQRVVTVVPQVTRGGTPKERRVYSYGRLVADLYVGSLPVADFMVSEGCAWPTRGREGLFEKAKAERKGIFSASEQPINPSDWRHKR